MEIYLPDAKYHAVATRLTRALRLSNRDVLVPLALRIDGLDHPGLLDALLALVPTNVATGEIDASDVHVALGEHADVWPASIREHECQ